MNNQIKPQLKTKELSESGKYFEEIFNKAKNPAYRLRELIRKRREENIKKVKQDWGI